MRYFEKISFEQFSKDVGNNQVMYDSIKLPKRATRYSAGYDFYSLEDMVIKPGEIKKIPTGLKVKMNENDVLMIFVRSSMGFKYNVRLCNQVGIIESDYYNNQSNEGHLWIKLQNEGDKDFAVKAGDAIAQGVFTTFNVVDNEEEIVNERTGGFGSTSKEG